LYRKGRTRIETSVHAYFEGKRIKHWVGKNSLKLYTEANVLRTETTLNDAGSIRVMRPPAHDPTGEVARRPMRRSVADLSQRATYCQAVSQRRPQRTPATFGARDPPLAASARAWPAGENRRDTPLPSLRGCPTPHSSTARLPQRGSGETHRKRRVSQESSRAAKILRCSNTRFLEPRRLVCPR